MKDGSKFEGEFKDGEINGYGVREWRDGRIYKGTYLFTLLFYHLPMK